MSTLPDSFSSVTFSYLLSYIYPVLDLDFVYGAVATSSITYTEEAKPVLVTVFPFNSKGSLKDLIYRVIKLFFKRYHPALSIELLWWHNKLFLLNVK